MRYSVSILLLLCYTTAECSSVSYTTEEVGFMGSWINWGKIVFILLLISNLSTHPNEMGIFQ
jgi:hypothetical protein